MNTKNGQTSPSAIAVPNVVLASSLTEREVGWGDRPDGYAIYRHANATAALNRHLEEQAREYPKEYSFIDGTAHVLLSEEGMKQVSAYFEEFPNRDWYLVNNKFVNEHVEKKL